MAAKRLGGFVGTGIPKVLLLVCLSMSPALTQQDKIQSLVNDIKAGPRMFQTPEAREYLARQATGYDSRMPVSSADRDAAVRSLRAACILGDMGPAAWSAVGTLVDMYPTAMHAVTVYDVYVPAKGTFEDWVMTKVMGEKNRFTLGPPFLGYEALSKCDEYIDVKEEHFRAAGDNVTINVTFTFYAGACALAKITGVNIGLDWAKWQDWWAANRASAAPPPASSWASGSTPTGGVGISTGDLVVGGSYRIYLRTGDEFLGTLEGKSDTSVIIETKDRGAFTFGTNLIARHELLGLPSKYAPDKEDRAGGTSEATILSYDRLGQSPPVGKTLEVRIRSGSVFRGVFVSVKDDILRIDIQGSAIPIARDVIDQISIVSAAKPPSLAPAKAEQKEEPQGPFDTLVVTNPNTDDYGKPLPGLVYIGKLQETDASVTIVTMRGDKIVVKRTDVEQIKRYTVDPYQEQIKRYAASLFCPADMVLVDMPPGKEGRPFFKVCIDKYEYPNKAENYPRGNVSYTEAQDLCKAAGKRLCSADEWQWACSGLEGYTYPYGHNYDKNTCNSQADHAETSGSRINCKSKYGVYDMVGNIFEWVNGAGGQPAMMGGPYSKCQTVSPGVGGEAKSQVGFRCCKSN